MYPDNGFLHFRNMKQSITEATCELRKKGMHSNLWSLISAARFLITCSIPGLCRVSFQNPIIISFEYFHFMTMIASWDLLPLSKLILFHVRTVKVHKNSLYQCNKYPTALLSVKRLKVSPWLVIKKPIFTTLTPSWHLSFSQNN